MIKVHMVGDSLLAGVGIGSHNAKGGLRGAQRRRLPKFKPGQFWSCHSHNDMLPFMREAAGIITEEGRYEQPFRHCRSDAG